MKVLGVALLILPILTAWFLWQDLRLRHVIGHVMAEGNPVSQAMVRLGEQTDTTNKNGEFIKIIIGGPLVSEGLTFKNIRQIHVLDPHWNLSRIDQIIGRGVRYKSHIALPTGKQTVDIFLYAAIPKNGALSIDLAKYQLSEKKDKSIKEIEYLIKTIAVDCYLNKKRNMLTEDNSRDCQYTKCKYMCPWDSNGKTKTKIDTDTYILEVHAKHHFNYITSKIKELFTHGYIYNLDYIINWVKKGNENVDEKDVYLTLNKLMGKPIVGPQNNIVTIIAVGEYYIANPENSKIRTLLFYKLYKKEIISDKLPITVQLRPSSIKKSHYMAVLLKQFELRFFLMTLNLI